MEIMKNGGLHLIASLLLHFIPKSQITIESRGEQENYVIQYNGVHHKQNNNICKTNPIQSPLFLPQQTKMPRGWQVENYIVMLILSLNKIKWDENTQFNKRHFVTTWNILLVEAGNSTSPVVDTTPQAFDVKDCLLPKVKGPCRAIIEQWFFNRVTKSCEPFQWSGCGGNNNRFSEKEFCTQHCATSTLTAPIKPSPSPSPSKKGVAEKCPKFEGCGPLKCGVSTDPDTGCEKCECHVGVQTDLRVNGTSKDVVTVVGSVSGNPDIPLPGSIPPGADNYGNLNLLNTLKNLRKRVWEIWAERTLHYNNHELKKWDGMDQGKVNEVAIPITITIMKIWRHSAQKHL